MKRKTFLMGAVMLLCAVLPSSLRADTVNAPCLCIEKTNGEVVKVEIAGDYPRLTYAVDNVVLMHQAGSTWIPREDIVRIYTTFELVDAINAAQNDAGKDAQPKVYNINGQRVLVGSDLKKLPRSVYVINNGGKIYKYVAQ